MKKIVLILVLIVLTLGVNGCSPADVASDNLSKAADQFEITRRIVFYNGITGDYILQIEGLCSLGNYDDPGEVTVTCKVKKDLYKKHFLGLSDNVTFFAEQIEANEIDPYHYRVIFRPEVVLPDIEFDLDN